MTSDQFRQHRLDLKLTQEALGEIMGMPARTISRIEYGARQPTNIQAAFIRHLVDTAHHLQQIKRAQDCS